MIENIRILNRARPSYKLYKTVSECKMTVKHKWLQFLKDLWYFKSTLIIIFIPLICLPLPLQGSQDVNVLFIGGLIIAIAVEESNLHKRIALRVLLLVGSSPRWLLLGFMSVTWFLSMWISNTATTAMMVPIVEAVLIELIKHRRGERLTKQGIELEASTLTVLISPEPINRDTHDDKDFLKLDKLSRDEIRLCRCLLLAIAYAANIGGTGTLTGTPPNIVMAGLIETTYGPDTGISFATWMAFSLPGALVFLFIGWFWIQLCFLGWRTVCFVEKDKKDTKVEVIIRQRYEQLGPFTWAEVSVLILFVCLVLLWLLRDPKFISGWSALFNKNFMSDGSAAIFITFFLFWLPSEKPDFFFFKSRDQNKRPDLRPPLLTWQRMQKKFPWGIAILLGGGFALGNAVQSSGLSALLGNRLQTLEPLGPPGLCAVAVVLMTFTTEVTSNTATANIFIPILCAVAEALKVNPLYFVLGITVCSSYAFMLPVATPPNAIVFSSGLLRVVDMASVGFMMNIFGILVMLLSINTWTFKMFNLGEFPDWAAKRAGLQITNSSLAASLGNNTIF